MKVILTQAAQQDFASQVAWLKARSPAAGRRAATAIVRSLDLLEHFPDLGTSIEPDVREQHVRFGQYGFVIQYERHSTIIVVRRIYHGAQDRSGTPPPRSPPPATPPSTS